MKKLLFIFLSLFLFLFTNSCKKAEVSNTSTCTNASTTSHPKGFELQGFIDSYVKQGIPGISLLVGDSNGVWYGAAGKADLENNITYAPCMVQKLGSITKMMMGVMVMKLVEEGTLHLDDKVSKWLDAKLIKDIVNADQVTLRNCLQHTTGIYDLITNSDFYLAVLHNPNKHWTGEELLPFVRNQTPMFAANTGVKYSNTNFLLLSLCIEKITGKSHSDLLHEKVFTPLKMNDTYYHTHDALPSITAQGYFDLYNKKTLSNVSNVVTGSGNGYTGVYSNVFDLQKFLMGVFINKSVISSASLNEMMQWKKDQGSEHTDFGLGIFRINADQGDALRIGHTGGDLGYASEVYYFPKTNRYYVINVNYGTNGDSFLKPTYLQMVKELADLVRK